MKITDLLSLALSRLGTGKLRTALTMLGIIIGVAAVITMLAVGTGASVKLQQQAASIGSNIILIVPGSTTSGGARSGTGSNNTLVLADLDAITANCPAIEAAAPSVRGSAQVVFEEKNWSTSVMGTNEDYERVRDWKVTSGRYLNRQDIDGRTKNCIVGKTIVDELFGQEDPIGKIIRIKKVPFTIVGVLEARGQSPVGQDQDDTILVPVTTGQSRLFGITWLNAIMAKGKSNELMGKAVDQVTALLHERHRIPEGEDDDFSVRNLSDMLAMAETQTKIMALLLGSVASVSLLVGGIGIMNIMLVSVTERTREIGIRMAVGAKGRDIMLQFLIEALVLSILGGLLGIGLGVLLSYIIGSFGTFTTQVTVFSVMLAFGFSMAVGIFFGFYPAQKAAGLDPIAALRYE
jgi:putative ABC transport system permease protein